MYLKFIVALLLSCNVSLLQEEDYRVWTSKDGTKKIEAKLESFNASSGSVKLIRRSGKSFSTNADNLSKEDRAYLESRNKKIADGKEERKLSDEQKKSLSDYGLQYSSSRLRLKDAKQLSSKLSAAKRQRQQLLKMQKTFARGEQQILDAKQKMRDLTIQDGQLNQQLPNATTVKENNSIVGMIEAVRAKSKLLADDIRRMEEERDAARGQLTQRKGEHIQSIVETRKIADALQQKFSELNNDQTLQKFVAEISKKLGKDLAVQPDASFRRLIKQLQDLEDGVVTEDVPLRPESDTWMISVTINEANTIEMVLDTGASSVCLPHRDAVRFGITPTSSDPPIRMQIADGSVISGRMVIIPTVRVGKFTVRNVECAVLEPSATNAPRLLGNSFLKNFNLDLKAGDRVLKMQEIK